MRKLLFTLVLSVFIQMGWSQTASRETLSLSENPGFMGIVDNDQYFAGNIDVESAWGILLSHENVDFPTIFEEGRLKNKSAIINSHLGFRYSDLMNIYKGRSLQLVKDIDSGRLFWSPLQSVLDKPFENTVFS